MFNNIVTLKYGLVVTQDYSNWYHQEAWVWFPIRLYSNSYYGRRIGNHTQASWWYQFE